MKQKKTLFHFLPIIFLILFFLSACALAQNNCKITPRTQPGGGYIYDCDFINPTTSNDLGSLIRSILAQLRPFLAMIAAMIILYAGFRYVVAVGGGKADPAKEAKRLFVPALIGAAILVGGEVILSAILNFFKK